VEVEHSKGEIVPGQSVTSNPSIERTSPGKPGVASHLKRLGPSSMAIELLTVNSHNICSFVGLYISVFNAPPWNDGWSETAVAERFESFARMPSFQGSALLVDKQPAALVFGWGERWVNRWHFHISELCVAPSMQRQNIGSNLLSSFEQKLIQAGFERVFLETGMSMPARQFYEKLGYKDLGLVSLGKRINPENRK
jgi:aminoglycoside 6'-N-acetyltransferase I